MASFVNFTPLLTGGVVIALLLFLLGIPVFKVFNDNEWLVIGVIILLAVGFARRLGR